MKRKIFSILFRILFALVLVVSFSLMTAVPVAAAGPWYVDDSAPGGGDGTSWANAFTTIQAAIDNVNLDSGDTILVAEGIYDEQVVIDKSLTLQGVGDTTVIQPSGAGILTEVVLVPWIPGTPAPNKSMAAIILVDTVGTVTVKDLKIDGSLITEVPKVAEVDVVWVAGLAYLETSGTIENLTVTGDPALGCRAAGIWASAITETALVEVAGCNVIGYNRAGIYAVGGTITADYHHNEINGPGEPLAAQVPNGMFFLRGATGSATYNTVTDLGYTGETYRSTGIGTFEAGTDVTFAYNTISNVQNAFALSNDTIGTIVEYNNLFNNQTGVRIESGAQNSIIQYNDIHDNTYAMRCSYAMGNGNVAHNNNFVSNVGTGIADYEGVVSVRTAVEGEPPYPVQVTLDATNNWWGHASGPYHATTNPTATGDSVSDHVNYDSWLTAEVGSATVGLTGEMPEIVAISVDPTSIDFGTLYPGDVSDPPIQLTISNIGTVDASVTTLILDDQGAEAGFFYDNLKLNANPAYDYSYTPLTVGAPGDFVIAGAHVAVPPTYPAVGSVTGTLVFVAEPTIP